MASGKPHYLLMFNMSLFIVKNGEWVEVTTDTRIPYGDVDSDMFNFPVYGHALDKRELWVPLLEKAYAKLHGTYEHIHGGSVCDALVDLTGGVGEKILLTDPSVKVRRRCAQLPPVAASRIWHRNSPLAAAFGRK